MPTEGADSKDVEMTDDMSTERDNADANEAKDSAEKAGGVDTKDSEEAAKTEHNVAKEKAEPVEDEQMESGDGKPTNGHVQGKGAEAQPVAESDQATNASKVDSEPEENTANGGGVAVSKSGDAVEKSPEREQSTPSSILEKGIIYFFFRGRVNIDEPSDVDDIARSYIVLRPLPHGAKLGDGPIGDAGNNRLLALPKKVLPVSPKDRFMVFVEKPSASMEEIKNALASSDYMTKTAGARHTPAAAPIGEGVYAITTTGRESYIAYMLTIPSELSEVQHDVGLKERGSFVTSVKNPQYPGPTNTNLPKGPEFPQEYGTVVETFSFHY